MPAYLSAHTDLKSRTHEPTNEPWSETKKPGRPDLLDRFFWVVVEKNLHVHYLCKLQTYCHQICTAAQVHLTRMQQWTGSPPVLPIFRGHRGQNVKTLTDAIERITTQHLRNQFLGNSGGRNRNPCTQILVILRATLY